MNDIVITYSENINSEKKLKMLLRGIENECEGYNEIFIVGDKPEWIQGVIHVGFSNEESRKYQLKNQYKKLKAVSLRQDLSDNFIWIDCDNDLVKLNATVPIRLSVDPSSPFFEKPSGTDKIAYEHTIRLMQRRCFFKNNYFNKFPVSMSKERLWNTFDEVDFETSYGYCIKTLYCNFNRLEPTCGFMEKVELTKYIKSSSYEKIK